MPLSDSPKSAAVLRILSYHRIAEPDATPDLNPRLVSATPREFDRQMGHLAVHYAPVSMEQVLEAALHGGRLPRRAVLITFDDGYRDFQDAAWPILEKHRLPACLFVPTAFPGQDGRAFWWDDLYAALRRTRRHALPVPALGRTLPLATADQRHAALKALQDHVKTLPHDRALAFVDEVRDGLGPRRTAGNSTLNWDELRRLAGKGVTLGAHTRNHPILPRLARDEVAAEVGGSMRDLRAAVGATLPVFAYPNGSHDASVVEVVKEQGVQLAVTELDGFNDLRSTDRLRLRRTDITRRTAGPLFMLRLQRWFSPIDRFRHRRKKFD